MNNQNNNDWQTGFAIRQQNEKNRIQQLELKYARATDPEVKRQIANLLENEKSKQKGDHQTMIVVTLFIILLAIILAIGALWYTGALENLLNNLK